MKTIVLSILLLFFIGAAPRVTPHLYEQAGFSVSNELNTTIDCQWQGIELYGRVQFVESFPDIKVQIVESFPDIKVQLVESFPDACGEWQVVESFPDFKVQIVESFPDLKVQFVDSFPGMN